MRSASPVETAAPAGRLASLDGLRGLAAVVVLLHHSLLLVPSLAAVYYAPAPVPISDPWRWILVHSPAHLTWAGTEAVYVFFVLSGVVLTFPVIRSSAYSWSNYYPKRAVRLYIPVVAAVAFGFLLIQVIPRVTSSPISAWLQARPTTYPLYSIERDLTLIFGVSRTISPLWSLTWEVWFSILLPLFVFLGRWRLPPLVKAGLLILAIAAGSLSRIDALMYLPMFGVGVLMATEWPRLEWVAGSVVRSRYRALVMSASIACGCVLIYCYWIVLAFGNHVILLRLTVALATIGAALIILCVGFVPRIRHAMSRPVFVWLGRVSFSLYLTHEPIVIASGFLFAKLPPVVPIGISIALAFPVAWLFHRTIEVPSLRLAQWAGRRFVRARPAPSQVDVAEGA